jgi:hypothetical protein
MIEEYNKKRDKRNTILIKMIIKGKKVNQISGC